MTHPMPDSCVLLCFQLVAKGFGDGTPPTTPQSLKSLWTAQPTANVETKPVQVDVTQSPLFIKRSSTTVSDEGEAAASPKPATDTPFKFKVTICPNRREVVADFDPSLSTPRKDYIPIVVPKLDLHLPPTPTQKQPDSVVKKDSSGSVRKRGGASDYTESPAKRRRISFGTKSVRKTIFSGFSNGTASKSGDVREIPTAESIFAPIPPPLSSSSSSSSSNESSLSTPRSRSGSVTEPGHLPEENNGAVGLPTSAGISSIPNFTVPASKEHDVTMTVQEIAAWSIFGQEDNEILVSFILSYIHFKHTPKELFKIVWTFYHQPPLQYWKLISTFANQRARVVNFVSVWVRVSPNDFEWLPPPPQTPGISTAKGNKIPLKFYAKFVDVVRSDGGDVSALENAQDNAASKCCETPRKSMASTSSASSSTSSSSSGASSPRKSSLMNGSTSRRQSKYSARRQSSIKAGEAVTLSQIEPGELALQMTLVDWNRLRSVPLTELVGQAWNKADKAHIAPRLTNIINHFNNVSFWVSQEVVQADGMKEQAKMIDRFITVGNKLKDLGNFNGLMQIFSGLMASSVQKLQEAWKLISSKQLARYRKFEAIMSPFQNSSVYRTRLTECLKSPVIPYIGIHLGDIVHLLEGIDDEVPDKYALQKVLKLGNMLKMWHMWQMQSCDIVEDNDITQFLALLRGAICKD